MPAIPAALRTRVYERDDGRCQRCARHCLGGNHSIQHRQPRGMGGSTAANTLPNLVLLCGDGVRGCHGHVESRRDEAYADGWLVHRWDNPATTPVLRFGRTWSQPGEGWTATSPPEVSA